MTPNEEVGVDTSCSFSHIIFIQESVVQHIMIKVIIHKEYCIKHEGTPTQFNQWLKYEICHCTQKSVCTTSSIMNIMLTS